MNTYAQSKIDAYKKSLKSIVQAVGEAQKTLEEFLNKAKTQKSTEKHSVETTALLGVGLSMLHMESAIKDHRNAVADALGYAKSLTEEAREAKAAQ